MSFPATYRHGRKLGRARRRRELVHEPPVTLRPLRRAWACNAAPLGANRGHGPEAGSIGPSLAGRKMLQLGLKLVFGDLLPDWSGWVWLLIALAVVLGVLSFVLLKR